MAGTITHEWQGTTLIVTSDSGTSGCDLKGAKGDIGIRGPQGKPGNPGFEYEDFTEEQLESLKPKIDDEPTSGSTNAVSSGGVKAALDTKLDPDNYEEHMGKCPNWEWTGPTELSTEWELWAPWLEADSIFSKEIYFGDPYVNYYISTDELDDGLQAANHPAETTEYWTGRYWFDAQQIYRRDFTIHIKPTHSSFTTGIVDWSEIFTITELSNMQVVVDAHVHAMCAPYSSGELSGTDGLWYCEECRIKANDGGFSFDREYLCSSSDAGVIVTGYVEYVKELPINTSTAYYKTLE